MSSIAFDLQALLSHRYNISVEYDCDDCIKRKVLGYYNREERLIVLRNPIELEPDIFFHEATHAIQHVLAYSQPLGFLPTEKGRIRFGKVKEGYAESEHDLEREAFCVESSRTYKKLLFELANGDILLKDLQATCRRLLG